MKLSVGLLLVSATIAQTHAEVALKHFGWANMDYGYGNNPAVNDSDGNDYLGTAQLALGAKASMGDLVFVGVIGSDALSIGGSAGAIGIKDAFLDWGKIGGTGFGLSLGAQPFLFGLKASGYPGDRSLSSTVEFGGAKAKAISQQAGPSVKLRYDILDKATVTVGTFDNNGRGKTGSSPINNQFVDVRFQNAGIQGLYGFAGFERAYVGGAIDEAKPIIDAGLGFKTALFDVSCEYISMDKDWAGTADTESYIVAEATVNPTASLGLYGDYSRADQLDVQTIRAGVTFKSHDALTWILEYGMDMLGAGGDDPTTVIARANFSF